MDAYRTNTGTVSVHARSSHAYLHSLSNQLMRDLNEKMWHASEWASTKLRQTKDSLLIATVADFCEVKWKTKHSWKSWAVCGTNYGSFTWPPAPAQLLVSAFQAQRTGPNTHIATSPNVNFTAHIAFVAFISDVLIYLVAYLSLHRSKTPHLRRYPLIPQ